MSDRIEVDQRIHPGEEFFSASQEYRLVLQEDSNFVLYRRNEDGEQALWASNTWSEDGCENKSVILQTDGNFVLYDADGSALWASGSNYEAVRPFILIQDDGNVCLYDEEVEGCHWASETCQ